MSPPRRHLLLRMLACTPRWAGPALPGLQAAAGGAAMLTLAAPQAASGAQAAALDSAPFFPAPLAQAVGGSMVAAEWRGDYAQAARLADDALQQARKSGPAPVLADALCSRAAVALLAGNAGQAQRLLDETRALVADDPLRKAWVDAYGYAVHVQRYRLLPGGSSSIKDDLVVRDRMRIPPSRYPDAPALTWIMTEYSTITQLKGQALDDRLAALRGGSRQMDAKDQDPLKILLGYAPDGHRKRVLVCEADALRRSGRRAQALTALEAVRAAYAQEQDAWGVLTTEVLEGDWLAAPMTTPEDLNLSGAAEMVDAWEVLELDTREVDLPRAREVYQRAEARARSLRAPRALAAISLRRALLARMVDDLAGAEVQARQAMERFDACGDRLGYWTARWHAALARAASGQPAQDVSVAVDLALWARGEGSYSHAFGLGLIGERAARHSLLRSGSPELSLSVRQLTDTLFQQLGAWLTLVQARDRQADERVSMGDYVGAAAAMMAAADAMDQRLLEQRGLFPYELSSRLGVFGASLISMAGMSAQPEALEQAQGRASRYLPLLRDAAASFPNGNQRDLRASAPARSAGVIEEWLRPVKAHIAWLRGLEQLRFGEVQQADRQFRIVLEEAVAPATGSARQTLSTLLMATHLARRDYPAAAALARSNFDRANEPEQQFGTQLLQQMPSRPEGMDMSGMVRALWTQHMQSSHSLAFTALVLARDFDAAEQHLVALEGLGGPRWWQASRQPWVNRADCARLREGQGRLDEAAVIYREAIGLLENRRGALRADVLKVSLAAQQSVARIYLNAAHNALRRREAATDAAAREQIGDEAFEFIERVKARGLLDLMGGERASRSAPAAQAAGKADDVATLLRSWQRSQVRVANWQSLLANNSSPGTAGGTNAADGRQAFLKQKIAEENQRIAELDQLLARRGAEAPELAKAQSALLKPAQVARLLPPRSVLMQMAVLDDDLLLCTISATGEVFWHREALDAPALLRDMRRLRAACENLSAHREVDALAARIAKTLFGPVDHILAAHEQVLVVPHGPGYAVPFAALPWRGAPLAERLAVTQIPSASVLPFLLRTAPAPDATMLVIGNPARMAYKGTFDRSAQPMKPLPNAESEARAVVAGYSGSTLLTGAAATAAAVRSALPRHRILHLATHGVLSEEAPMLSSLLLANGEALTLDDLMGLRLDADLAVLSACNTGNGQENDGNDVLGFTRGLLVAGARSAIVSLWPVDDAATRLLMEHFYAGLRRGQTSAAALRSAQMALRAMPGEVAATATGSAPATAPRHPHYWAAFVLVG